jgi:chitinase
VATQVQNAEQEIVRRIVSQRPNVGSTADLVNRSVLWVSAALNLGKGFFLSIYAIAKQPIDVTNRFCGSIPEFCDAGCQKGFGGCGDEGRNIGYYESWANTRACSAVSPEDLNLNGFTHLNFAFVFFDPTTFDIVPMDKNAGELLHRFTALKEKKSGLQTWVSVGGWSFNDRKSLSFHLPPVVSYHNLLTLMATAGSYQQAFSTMASTASNRARFIENLIKFMTTYGFDGVDLDWEYPSAGKLRSTQILTCY